MRVIASLIVLAGCGHTLSATIGASRRSDGTPGALVTVGAEQNLVSGGDRELATFGEGVRAGVGVDADGTTRLVLTVGGGFAVLPRDRGGTMRLGGSIGTSARAELWAGAAWRRYEETYSWHVCSWCDDHDYRHVHFAELGVVLGAEYGLVAASYIDASIVFAAGWLAASMPDD